MIGNTIDVAAFPRYPRDELPINIWSTILYRAFISNEKIQGREYFRISLLIFSVPKNLLVPTKNSFLFVRLIKIYVL